MTETPVLVDVASDESQVAYGKRTKARKDEATFDRLAGQLSTYEGRAFVWDLLERGEIFQRAPIGNGVEAIWMFVGARENWLTLFNELCNEHPDAFVLMQTEHLQRKARERAELAAAKVQRKKATEAE